ncbi:hypothetical protein YC2023_050348 [Brassica napus]|nr:unnamed protein product [Brassica napus]
MLKTLKKGTDDKKKKSEKKKRVCGESPSFLSHSDNISSVTAAVDFDTSSSSSHRPCCVNPRITFTPTIQHCSMATIIGLCLRTKLKECLPLHYNVNYDFKLISECLPVLMPMNS